MILQNKIPSALSTKISSDVGIVILLSITVWAARYLHSAQFGLYEDDLTIIPTATQMAFPELLNYILNYIVHLYGHARPISNSLIFLFSNLGWKMAGIWGAYWIGYAIITLNACLFYFLLRRVYNQSLAILGALAYALYSADSTQAFLTHSLGLQPSLTLLLLAFHNYLSKRRWLAYFLALIILFSYETPFTVFFAAPLLLPKWDRQFIRDLFLHILILGVMLASVFLLRSAIGEGRITELSFPDMITQPLDQMRLGPFVNLRINYLHIRHAMKAVLRGEITLAVIVAFIVLSGVFWRLNPDVMIDFRSSILAFRRREWRAVVPEELKKLTRLAITGCVMLVLGYPLTFTVPASVILGRGTRVHAASVVGMAILIACGGALFWYAIRATALQPLGAVMLAGLFALQVGYGFMIQQEYILSWQYQRDFWTDLVPLVGDAGQQTVILVTPDVFIDTDHIGANTWNLPRILPKIYRFPLEWENPPRVYRLIPDWDSHIRVEECELKLDWETVVAPPSLYQIVSSTDAIFIEGGPDGLERRSTPLTIKNRECPFKFVDQPGTPHYPKGFLFDYLIQSPGK